MSYLKPNEAAKAFRAKGNKVYGSYDLAVKSAKKVSGRTAVMSIGGGKYVVKKV